MPQAAESKKIERGYAKMGSLDKKLLLISRKAAALKAGKQWDDEAGCVVGERKANNTAGSSESEGKAGGGEAGTAAHDGDARSDHSHVDPSAPKVVTRFDSKLTSEDRRRVALLMGDLSELGEEEKDGTTVATDPEEARLAARIEEITAEELQAQELEQLNDVEARLQVRWLTMRATPCPRPYVGSDVACVLVWCLCALCAAPHCRRQGVRGSQKSVRYASPPHS